MSEILTSDVFGIAPEVSPYTYIDRGDLDEKIQRHLNSKKHIALKGASKCGKTWLRQKCIPNSNVVQCRIGKPIVQIYTEALANLGIKLVINEKETASITGSVEAQGEFGAKLLAKVIAKVGLEAKVEAEQELKNIKHDINNIGFIAETIKASEKWLIIEDFHYLSKEERRKFAFDLKALWDLGCFVIIVGVWSQSNLLSFINPDLSGRIYEETVDWSDRELMDVLENGSESLNISISSTIKAQMIRDSYQNVGILQSLAFILVHDKSNIAWRCKNKMALDNISVYNETAQEYARQLNGLYQQFAKTVSAGIRKRNDSTGIYPISMRVIIDSSDNELLAGLSRMQIYERAHKIQPRIQQANLKTILSKLDELQQDDDGRGLVISYDESTDAVQIVDRQLLFYRKYLTTKWPWDEDALAIGATMDELTLDDFLEAKPEE